MLLARRSHAFAGVSTSSEVLDFSFGTAEVHGTLGARDYMPCLLVLRKSRWGDPPIKSVHEGSLTMSTSSILPPDAPE